MPKPIYKQRRKNYYLEKMSQWHKYIEKDFNLKCEDCGYDENPRVIEFHHKDPSKKCFEIGKFTNGKPFNADNKRKVANEIKKCKILCSNCHKLEHIKLNCEASKPR